MEGTVSATLIVTYSRENVGKYVRWLLYTSKIRLQIGHAAY